MPEPRLTPITPADLRQRAGRVCVALSGQEIFALAEQTATTETFLEFRLDSLSDAAAALHQLRHFLHDHANITAVATCRRKEYGGNFTGTAAEQLEILREAAQAGCGLVDIETETAEELGTVALETLRNAGAAVILSWHDFEGTPALEPQLERMAPFAPDFRKIVATAQTLRDSLRLIDLLQQHGAAGGLIAMSMGFCGILTRVLGPRFGSAFTFAAPDGNAGTAPGQMSASTLRKLYRIDSITPSTAVYAVAGEPITGSLSPRMHNTAFAAARLDAVYLPLETADPVELAEAIDTLGIRGLSITMPLKETILPMLTAREHAVETMKACNTLVRNAAGGFDGFNTDVAGIIDPLQQIAPLAGKSVLLIGAGGAARAAAFGLRDARAHVWIMNRTSARAEALAEECGAQAIEAAHVESIPFEIAIHSTPYGMKGQVHQAPIDMEQLNAKTFFDLVYNPLETPLIAAARARGMLVITGAEMFVAQGVRQFELWTEQPAPEAAMLEAVKDALS